MNKKRSSSIFIQNSFFSTSSNSASNTILKDHSVLDKGDKQSCTQHTTRFFSSSPSLSPSPLDQVHESPEIAKLVMEYARKRQTSASLQTLMKTGRGEFLHKTFPTKTAASTSSDGTDNNKNNKKDGKIDFHNEEVENEGIENHSATDKVLIQVAGFLRRELPIRLARRVVDLSRVPYMHELNSVRQVKELYIHSFLELVNFDKKIRNMEQEEKFAKVLESIYERHAGVLVQMARGAFELRKAIREGQISFDDSSLQNKNNTHTSASQQKQQQQYYVNGKSKHSHSTKKPVLEFEQLDECHAFLDRFYVSRIGIRVLIGQYLALRQKPVENYIGIICSKTSPYQIVKRAIEDATFMCTRRYGDAPDVIIKGKLDFTFPYLPTHLHYVMLELLKNSMRATMDWHYNEDFDIDDIPPINVVIAYGNDHEDVVIKVSDEGGGIQRSNMKKIWSYLFTTADPKIQEGMMTFNDEVDHSVDSPLAGLGYGLPISRSYARYFGGDLSIMSMEGYGTDAFVHLTRLGNTQEPLPT
eukprot:CAMPEP_0178959728 /NCGR_PEP_ID=MMETSP0789-20121207/12482_1 /TAXON_ID=3005 /ORGANISM="Rhizosolenia setigera, Strain CCMP 1694" /LENGTH=527 /DNA_ID=CAMNT_0020642823 /DNA_START=167 /DNA_END=1750 /DNA_ORIENTATION=+